MPDRSAYGRATAAEHISIAQVNASLYIVNRTMATFGIISFTTDAAMMQFVLIVAATFGHGYSL
jgi:hypothetical protein